jgi:hypothetical protein
MVHPYVKSFIKSRSLHDPRDQVIIVNVVIINLIQETTTSSVISWLASAIA